MIVYRDLNDVPELDSSVLTIGSFDGIHTAHKKIITLLVAKAREYETKSVILTFSPHPRYILGENETDFKLLSTDEEKIKYLEETGIDILVIIKFTFEFSQLHPIEYIEKILYQKFHPKVVILGHDHRFGMNRGGNIDLLKQYENLFKYRVLKIKREDFEEITISSSKIRKFLSAGNLTTANLLLGRNYSFIAEVIHGDKLGTQLGFPTANLHLDKHKLIPAEGVYASVIHIGNKSYNGMTYIGKKYYSYLEPKDVLEVNIFNFNRNIYGEKIEVEIVDFIRHGIKFTSREQIINQLNKDKLDCAKSLSSIIKVPKENKNVAIVILNYNGVNYLKQFLESVIQNTTLPARIIVADNSSSDGSVDFLRKFFPEVEIYELSDNFGFSMGYNRVIKSIVDCEYIVFLNSDVETTKDWLNPIISAMDKDKSIAIAQPKILAYNDKKQFEYAGAAGGYIDKLSYPFCRGRIFETIENDLKQYNDDIEVFWASGAAMVVRKQVFDDLKGFDPDFFAHQEEIDLAWRAKRAGYKIMAFGEPKVYHVGGGTLSYINPMKTYLNFRNNLVMMLKNESWSKIIWKFPLRLILDGIAAFKFLFEGKPSGLVSILKAHLYVYAFIIKILAKRKYYNDKIMRYSISDENESGYYDGYIVYDYYINGKKKFSEIDKQKLAQPIEKGLL